MIILPKLHYDCYDFVDPIGLSCGLWLCWKSNVLTLNIILNNDMMFHCMVYVPNHNFNCFITLLYGYLKHFKQKKKDILQNIKDSISGS